MTVHQLKVTLADVRPVVWRRLQVRSETTLAELHRVLQVAMGWEDYHMHAFHRGWGQYGGSQGGDSSPESVSLAAVLPEVGDEMIYQYDFGDDWEHVVEVEKILTGTRSDTPYPRCIAGRRACPPEDVGGPPGYADMLRALRARKGPRYQEIREWLPRGRFDPEAFDLDAVNADLRQLGAVTAGG